MREVFLESQALLPSTSAWLLYFFCAFLMGMSKTGIQNIGTIAVPIFAFLFGAKYSTGIVLILLCMADLMAIIYYRKSLIWSEVIKLLPSALTGLVTGLFIGEIVNDQVFKMTMGACILIGVVIMFWSKRQTEERLKQIVDKKWFSSFFGFLVGFSTMIGNAAGPAMSVYLLTKRLPKYTFVAVGAWFIMILNYAKIPLQIFVWKNLSWVGFALNIMAIPAIVLGGVVGILIVKRLNESYFKHLITGLVILSAALLIVL